MEAALHAATLLARENKAEQARAELLGLVFNPKVRQWHGALKSLSLYVKVEEECRHRVEQALNRLTAAALKKHGIRLERRSNRPEVREQILIANEMFRASSRAYSQLLMRSLSAATEPERAAIVQELRSFSKSEKVGFFRTQAKETIRQLSRR